MVTTFRLRRPFQLESGETLPDVVLAYTTMGQLNSARDNVVWICHALTANAEPTEWWGGLVGAGRLYDPAEYYIVCANMLGSCYGSTGAASVNPETGKKYGRLFPLITIRDIVLAQMELRKFLGIDHIFLATGGSMGGQQVLEWSLLEPGVIDHMVVIGTNARHSPWGIAFNETQRMALEADDTLYDDTPEAGAKGIEAARAIGMLSYRNYEAYHRTQMDDEEKLDHYRASSYQRYQGEKLRKRFDPLCYWTLSKAMDSHDVGRGRGGWRQALSQIASQVLVFGIASDFLFPLREQQDIVTAVPGAQLEIIDSPFGHDGFLIEFEQLTHRVKAFLQ